MALKEVSGPSLTSTQGTADGDKASGGQVGPGIFVPFPQSPVTCLPSEDLALVETGHSRDGEEDALTKS